MNTVTDLARSFWLPEMAGKRKFKAMRDKNARVQRNQADLNPFNSWVTGTTHL